MKFTMVCFGIMAILVFMVALTGCTGSSQQGSSSPGAQTTQAVGGAQQSPVGGSPSGPTAGQVLGALNYNWVEYKMTSGDGGQQVTMYFKFDKQKGTCTMRIEGQNMPGMTGQEMSCGSTSGETQSNPNQMSSDVTLTYIGIESVTVPAGTFMASKYTSTYQGTTSTYWMVGGTPLLKVVSGGGEGSSTMELNGWG
jgi:hypothetical protein